MKAGIYLDNAATSFPKPASVAKAMAEIVRNIGGNPGRGAGGQTIILDRMIYKTREAIAKLLGLSNPERIIFTKNATEGINIALKGMLKRGDTALISRLEHNAVIRPLAALKRKGVKVRYAPHDKLGLPDPKKLPQAKMLAVTGASNVTGAIADVGKLAGVCRKRGIVSLVDAAQTAGSIKFDTSQIDVLVCAGHKALLGPQGTGFVYFAPGIEPDTWLEGGSGSNSDDPQMPSFWPDRFEAGTVNSPGIAGLKAGVDWLLDRGLDAVRDKEARLVGLILEMTLNNKNIEVYPPFDPERRAGLVCFNIKGMDPAKAGYLLDKSSVALRVGLHCSPEAHKFIGTFPDGALRVSPGALTKIREVKMFLSILTKIAGGK